MEFLAQAKLIVAEHEHLKISSYAVQRDIEYLEAELISPVGSKE